MSTPYGQSPHDDEAARQDPQARPAPRYGQYAPQPEAGEGQPTGGEPTGGQQYNPYGQPSWGPPQQQAQSGQSGWSQQPGAGGPHSQPPQGYVPPGGHAPGARKPKRPATLVTAMWMLLGAGVASLVWGIYVLINLPANASADFFTSEEQDMFQQQLQNDPQFESMNPQEAAEMAMLGFGVMALLWAAVLLAIYITLAFVGTMTGNVGRILATIWVGGSLLMLLLGHDPVSYSLIGLVILLGILAVVLLWLPDSNQYVERRRAFKHAQTYAGYAPAPQAGGPQQGPYNQGPYNQDPYNQGPYSR